MQNQTLETLINILRKRLQDEEFDKETLRIFINDSMQEILGEDKFPFMERIDKYTANASGEVNLPPFYGGTFFIYGKQGDEPRQKLEYIAPEAYFENTKVHTFVYTVFANTLFYRLREDPDHKGFEITHLYLTNPLPMVKDSDISPIPPQYTEALVLGALARAEETRDNYDFAQIFRNQQDQLLTNMKLRFGQGNLTAENRARLPFCGGYADERV